MPKGQFIPEKWSTSGATSSLKPEEGEIDMSTIPWHNKDAKSSSPETENKKIKVDSDTQDTCMTFSFVNADASSDVKPPAQAIECWRAALTAYSEHRDFYSGRSQLQEDLKKSLSAVTAASNVQRERWMIALRNARLRFPELSADDISKVIDKPTDFAQQTLCNFTSDSDWRAVSINTPVSMCPTLSADGFAIAVDVTLDATINPPWVGLPAAGCVERRTRTSFRVTIPASSLE